MLREVVEGLARITAEFERAPKIKHRFFSLFIIATTSSASFSPSLYVCSFFFAVGLLLALYSKRLKAWVLATGLATFFAFVVSLPVWAGFLESGVDVALFVARAASAAAVMTGGVLASSWWGFLEGLRGVIPRDLRRALELMPVYVYLIGREALVKAAAREARLFKPDIRAVATAVGDILLYGLERGRTLRLAYEARSP
jgi:cobalt/nickel transport system permease protein